MRDRNIWISGPCEHDHPHVFDLECVLELDEDICSFCLYVHTFSMRLFSPEALSLPLVCLWLFSCVHT